MAKLRLRPKKVTRFARRVISGQMEYVFPLFIIFLLLYDGGLKGSIVLRSIIVKKLPS